MTQIMTTEYLLLVLFWVPNSIAQTPLRLPPIIVSQSVSSIIYRNDDSVTLECRAEGTANITYKWKKNGIDLNQALPNINGGVDGTITISPATSLDEGYYQCFAENQFGTVPTNTSHIQRAFLHSVSGSPIVVNQTVREGEPFQIRALTRMGFPKPVYSWEIANDAVDRNPLPFNPTKRVQIADNGDLHFAYATPEDENNGKIYKSTTFNQYLDIKAGGSYTRIKIIKAPEDKINSAPKLGFASEKRVVGVDGLSVTLHCFFHGKPEPTVSWKDPKGHLSREGRYKLDKFNTELTISNITASDEGVYVCTGLNSEADLSHSIQLSVERAPVFKRVADGPHNVNVTEGRSFTFHCKADAKPDADIVWLQNGQEIKEEPRRYVISADRKSLKIADLCLECEDRKTDITVIQCNASNRHGYAFASGYLNIFQKTKITSPLVQLNDTNDSNEAVLECSVSHDPSTPVTWKWFKLNRYGNDTRYEEIKEIFGSRLIKVTKGILRNRINRKNFTEADIKDKFYGTYVCVADTGISSDNQTFVLQQPTPPPTTTPSCVFISFEPFWLCYVIYAAIGLFVILLFFICICCLCYNYRHNEEYDVDAKEHWTGSNPEKELMAFGFHEAYRVETISRTLKSSKASLSSATLLRIDEEDNMNDYGDDMGKFNEDGSFVGTYRSQSRGGFM